MKAADLVQSLQLAAHPEGGWYRELYRSSKSVQLGAQSRSATTAIYYLLERQQLSRWHVIDADEIWHFYAGAPLELLTYDPASKGLTRHVLDAPSANSHSVGIVPPGVWQAARSLGEYSLVGCTVSPGFEFSGFRFVVDLPDHRAHFSGELAAFASWL